MKTRIPKPILLVEDQKFLAQLMDDELKTQFDVDVVIAECYADAKNILHARADEFYLSIVDLTLPDCMEGEIVDLMNVFNLPVIVTTGLISDDIRDLIWGKDVVDYIIKDNSFFIEYTVALLNRYIKNADTKVLIVDDSKFTRQLMNDMLKLQNFQVLEAENGVAALEVVQNQPDIKLVITDNEMPKMNGVELVSRLRIEHGRHKMGIIGISGAEDARLSSKFIKYGANDFLKKPFDNEEFYCRIHQNLEVLDQFEQLEESSNKDYLTGLYNRKYLHDLGRKMFHMYLKGQVKLHIAMLDVDYFKKINDTYGHLAGDAALKELADILQSSFGSDDLIVRSGGEEFCVLLVDYVDNDSIRLIEELRKKIEHTELKIGQKKISFTISIGLNLKPVTSLEYGIKVADQFLYKAKHSGRNRLIY